jgi:hypothetical protein
MPKRPSAEEAIIPPKYAAYDFAQASRILEAMDFLRKEAVQTQIPEIIEMIDASFTLMLTTYYAIMPYRRAEIGPTGRRAWCPIVPAMLPKSQSVSTRSSFGESQPWSRAHSSPRLNQCRIFKTCALLASITIRSFVGPLSRIIRPVWLHIVFLIGEFSRSCCPCPLSFNTPGELESRDKPSPRLSVISTLRFEELALQPTVFYQRPSRLVLIPTTITLPSRHPDLRCLPPS